MSAVLNQTANNHSKLNLVSQEQNNARGKIYDDITQTIGNTPLVRLSRLADKFLLEANILAKVEYFNPAGSIKDRPALAMINALIDRKSVV